MENLCFFPVSSPGTRQNTLRNPEFLVIFRKMLDEDLTKITKKKCHEKSISRFSTMQLPKNNDFQLLNGFDHQHKAIRGRSWKIVVFYAKIVRIAQNHKNRTAFSTIYLVLVIKIVFRIVIFRKILDGTLEKSQKCHEKLICKRYLTKNCVQNRHSSENPADKIKMSILNDAKIIPSFDDVYVDRCSKIRCRTRDKS